LRTLRQFLCASSLATQARERGPMQSALRLET
jgi:hypothetical protein